MVERPAHRLKAAEPCPFCGYLATRHFPLDGDEVKPGDVSICFNCTWPSIFDENRRLRRSTREERDHLAQDPRVRAVVIRLLSHHGRAPLLSKN